MTKFMLGCSSEHLSLISNHAPNQKLHEEKTGYVLNQKHEKQHEDLQKKLEIPGSDVFFLLKSFECIFYCTWNTSHVDVWLQWVVWSDVMILQAACMYLPTVAADNGRGVSISDCRPKQD